MEKKTEFAHEISALLAELKYLAIEGITAIRILNVYDMEGVAEEDVDKVVSSVLAEVNTDNVYYDFQPNQEDFALQTAYLSGQFDQRADSAEALIEIISASENVIVKTSKLYLFSGEISNDEREKIKKHLINPIDKREIGLETPKSLIEEVKVPSKVKILEGFNQLDQQGLGDLIECYSLSMSMADLLLIQEYFQKEERNPSITELRALDTYWSDHCRHTTFLTHLTDIEFADDDSLKPVKKAFELYQALRQELGYQGTRPISLMDLATISAKHQRKNGKLDDLDVSDEINACSIKIKVETDSGIEDWLLMFKNETHNHPTEIEPFGGAATCLGGAIRDPLSGRSYVYQAMRVTGAANVLADIEDTLEGKLAQRKITTEAALGYSSYGNQIGLATGQVAEVYHQGYLAKRMEVGFVIAGAPAENVIRMKPQAGDAVILLGGRTGRDGCGGATGSSKSHTEQSIVESGGEVQKGNAPTERKIQRLFRKPELAKLIKRCNDFGAGGVTVAIGEIADSLDIDLDKVPKKYAGLDGTEIAISESQERMAVVVSSDDVEQFIALAKEENLEATVVAKVTDSGRMRIFWQGEAIVDIAREFLDSNGAENSQQVLVQPVTKEIFKAYYKKEEGILEQLLKQLSELNYTAQTGMVEMFDSTVGAASVLMPFGGKYQQTPVDGMVAKLPTLANNSQTVSVATFGFDPHLAEKSAFHGAYYALIMSIAKQLALGINPLKLRLSLQEYFEKLAQNESKWGKPLSALLGALLVEEAFNAPAIGGKDSMSGSFGDINVPPSLLSFAVGVGKLGDVISPELKETNSKIMLYIPPYLADNTIDLEKLKKDYSAIYQAMQAGRVLSASAIGAGGASLTLAKMAFGNRIGVKLNADLTDELSIAYYGGLLLEVKADSTIDCDLVAFAQTIVEPEFRLGTEKLSLEKALKAYQSGLESVFPTKTSLSGSAEIISYDADKKFKAQFIKKQPLVYIPVFPGTNSEYDMARAFIDAGSKTEMKVFNNLNKYESQKSLEQMAEAIDRAQIIALSGGFSAGDEPDGSGKFIAAIFKNPLISAAVMRHLKEQDGLMLGICNGFQALIKSGLIPYGEIRDLAVNAPTLTHNTIAKHMSKIVNVRVASNNSPWLNGEEIGKLYKVAISHGEGRFYADKEMLEMMKSNGQIATQYTDLSGNVRMEQEFNPNGSVLAVEGAFSPDGRVFGKMGHTERYTNGIYKNVKGDYAMPIFKNGIKYFS